MPSDAKKKQQAKKKEAAKARQTGKKPASTNPTKEDGKEQINASANDENGTNGVLSAEGKLFFFLGFLYQSFSLQVLQ